MIRLKTNLPCLLITSLLTSCAGTPEIFQAVENIATDGVIQVQIDKEAFQKDTNIHVNVDILNRDVKQP
jgi:hypothetical protein